WVAAFGPKALAQAGRLGLPYLCSPMEGLQTLAANYAQHRQASLDEGVEPVITVPLMRTVYVSNDAAEIAQLRQRVASEVENTRLQSDEGVDDWTLIGDPAYVRDGIQRYQETLGMTHLVATRLRLPGLAQAKLRASVRLLAQTLHGV
ncbi:MAG: LLM class flavin-dependent oxidoreductase, partial [Proteobacteria bacterium]|nr:LLM class flavin-dependent oxidoreductase [Pseudomonadota bacterium]